jgi:hypothetical protein
MDQEKRQGRKPIPDHFRKLLNVEQLDSLRQLERFGWEICFIRMPLFQPLLVALYNETTDQYGTLAEDGQLDTESTLSVRS